MPDQAMLSGLYRAEYFSGGENGGYVSYPGDAAIHLRNARARLRLLDRAGWSPASPSAGVLVDIGCALGFFLEVARSQGWSPIGVDVSEPARAAAAARLDVPVYGSVEEIPNDGVEWSVVTCFQVLEHMADPAAALREARDRMTTGGALLIETWDAGSVAAKALRSHWHQVAPPSVVHLFDRPTLRQMLHRTGFEVIWLGSTGKRVSVRQATRLLANRYPRLFGPVDSRLSGWGIAAAPVWYWLGDLISVVAVAQ